MAFRNGAEAKAVTIDDVARQVGVSKMTVSYALNGKGRVSQATREAVARAAEEMKFEFNPSARQLANGRSHDVVGLCALSLDLGVGTRTLQLIQRALHDNGYFAPIHGYGYHVAEAEEEQAALMSALRRQRPRAIICSTVGMKAASLDELRRYQDEGGVVVCYSYGQAPPLECDQVVFDDEDNTFLAARHLLELGHRDIALFVNGDETPEGGRVRGLHRALDEHGIALRPEWLWNFQPDFRYEAAGAWIVKKFLSLPTEQRPSALCIVHDYTAAAFVGLAHEAGIRVPQDLSVVAFDDMPMARFAPVPLTTVSHPVEQIAALSIELLLARLKDKNAPYRHKWARGELVVRQSTALLPGD